MSRWTPALTGARARRAREIAFAIRAREVTAPIGHRSASLDGDAASALFLTYFDAVFGTREERAELLLESVLSRFPDLSARPHLFSGAIGAAIVVEHLANYALGHYADALREVPYSDDAAYDLAFGAAGRTLWGVTGSTALHRCLAAAAFATIANAVESDGLPVVLHRNDRGRPDGGVLHGGAGIAAATAQYMHVSGDAKAAMVSGALLQYVEADWRRAIERKTPRPQAWCTGDVGVASALFTAGCSGVPGARGVGLEIAATTIEARSCYAPLGGSSVCHGAAGVALAYHRFWVATNEERFRVAAVESYDHLLRCWPDDPIGNADGLLMGAAGVGLVLLSAISDVEPMWDCMLLYSQAAHDS